jgi:hypothetical protein
MSYADDDILTLKELAAALRLDPKTVNRVGYKLGGKRFGNRWRFRWGSAMEYFSNADIEDGQKNPCLDGKGGNGRETDRLQDVSIWEKTRPGMAGGKRMGGTTKNKSARGAQDPYGLRAAYAMG